MTAGTSGRTAWLLRIAAGTAALGLAVATAACGTSTSASTGSTSSPAALTLLPSADPFHSAVVATRALGTARLAVRLTRQTPAGPVEQTGAGVSVLGQGRGDLRWTAPGTAYRELVNERAIYVTSDDRAWTQWSLDDPTATSAYVDPLRGLGVLHDVTAEPDQTIGGVLTTPYTGWLPRAAPAVREDVTAWIDGSGHVIQVDREATDATGQSLESSSTSMSDFSLLLDLSSPSHDVILGSKPVP